jgi:hypothetical protein
MVSHGEGRYSYPLPHCFIWETVREGVQDAALHNKRTKPKRMIPGTILGQAFALFGFKIKAGKLQRTAILAHGPHQIT